MGTPGYRTCGRGGCGVQQFLRMAAGHCRGEAAGSRAGGKGHLVSKSVTETGVTTAATQGPGVADLRLVPRGRGAEGAPEEGPASGGSENSRERSLGEGQRPNCVRQNQEKAGAGGKETAFRRELGPRGGGCRSSKRYAWVMEEGHAC